MDNTTKGATINKQRKHLRSAHENIINNAQIKDGFILLDMPSPPRPLRFLTPLGVTLLDPASFFKIFFKEEDYDIFTRNTNDFALWHWVNYLKIVRWHPTKA